MRLLTLNTHSWMEQDNELQLSRLASFIEKHAPDIVTLQEVNQELVGHNIQSELFVPTAVQLIAPNESNFAYQLTECLRKRGMNYQWSWTAAHIGYDKFHEGVAILSKCALKPSELLVSETDDIHDFNTRKILCAQTEADGVKVCAVSAHYSWWDTPAQGFAPQFEKTCAYLKSFSDRKIVMGDFNVDALRCAEGYDFIGSCAPELVDAYASAKERQGLATAESSIDGWAQDEAVGMRIDYVLADKSFNVKRYSSVLDGHEGPRVSDHFGVLVELIA